MGIFDKLWGGAKKLWGWGKTGVNKVVDIGNKSKNAISKVYNTARTIPFIGNYVDKAADLPIPYAGGLSARQLANQGNKYLGYAEDINKFVNPNRRRVPPSGY